MAVRSTPTPEATLSPEARDILAECKRRRQTAIQDRRSYEPIWRLCQSFLAGRQWVGWNSRTRRVVTEPNVAERERHTTNMIGNYHQTVLGKLYVEDLRPDILFSREDMESRGVAEHAQMLAKYLWDTEIEGDKRMFAVLHKMLTFGTSALRCWFDPNRGQELGEVPFVNGQPIMDQQMAYQMMSEAPEQVQIQMLREGKIIWEALGPDNILPPPGVDDPDYFQWLIVERPLPVDRVRTHYPHVADRLKEQQLDATETLGSGRDLPSSNEDAPPAATGRIKGHVLVSTCYEMPCPEYPLGRVIVWTDNHLLEVQDQLPYRHKGEPHHGVFFFHYHRVDNRFWGKGVVEDLIGPQRQKNRARSQMIELKDRNLGRVYARKGTFNPMNRPKGKVMEVIEVPMHADFPQEVPGGGIGPWIENEARINDEDMDRIAGLREVSLGQAPTGVSAFSAMALLAEQDERRIGPALKLIRQSVGDCMAISLDLVRRYWPDNKQMAVAGPDGEIALQLYSRAMLPQEFYLDVSKSAPLPTSPATEAQKIFDLYHAAASSGQPLGIDWLKESLDAGKALPIPKREEQVQIGKAELENFMMQGGQALLPAHYDDDYVHIQVHRQGQEQVSQLEGKELWLIAIEQHIQMHEQNASMKKPTLLDSVPQQQGSHGIEAQNGMGVNMEGLAQQVKAPTNQGGTPNSASSQSA